MFGITPTRPRRRLHEPSLPREINRLDILIGCDGVQAIILKSGYIVRIVGHVEEGAPDAHLACGKIDRREQALGFSCTRVKRHAGPHVSCEIETAVPIHVDAPRVGCILAVWR